MSDSRQDAVASLPVRAGSFALVGKAVCAIRAFPAAFLALALILMALLGPALWPLDPVGMDFAATQLSPELHHPMGTDSNGRDILARFLAGARISLSVGAFVTITGLLAGGALGILAALGGRIADALVMRAMDALAAFPPLILAIAVTVGLGVGIRSAAFGIMLSSLPYFARLMKSEILRVRSRPFVESSLALGAGRARIILRHILPHTAPTMTVQCASVFGSSILTLAGLGFIGLGAQIPEAEWGAMIADGLQYTLTGQWWLAFFPGLGVLIVVLVANDLADSVQASWRPN